MSEDLPQFYGLPHEGPNEHIKIFLEYFLKYGITDPWFIIFIFPHSLQSEASDGLILFLPYLLNA